MIYIIDFLNEIQMFIKFEKNCILLQTINYDA